MEHNTFTDKIVEKFNLLENARLFSIINNDEITYSEKHDISSVSYTIEYNGQKFYIVFKSTKTSYFLAFISYFKLIDENNIYSKLNTANSKSFISRATLRDGKLLQEYTFYTSNENLFFKNMDNIYNTLDCMLIDSSNFANFLPLKTNE